MEDDPAGDHQKLRKERSRPSEIGMSGTSLRDFRHKLGATKCTLRATLVLSI